MTRNFPGILLGLAMVGSLVLLVGCGPKYPNCETDEHCKDRGQYCVNKMCRDCADDSHCAANNPCQFCGDGYSCQKQVGCCTSDLDCPGGRCWKVEGTNLGQCGTMCKDNSHCPAGQECINGVCQKKAQCVTDADCQPGYRCMNGQCVLSDCQLEPIYFDFNESTLTSEARQKLNSNADCMKKRAQSVVIEGHCDERGSDEYNMVLGERRAKSARNYLSQLGVSNNMRTVSYGEERPVCHESSESCWWRNRRAEFLFQ